MKANAQLRIWTCYCLSATQTSWTWKILHETKFRKKKKEEIEQEQTEETFPWLKEKKISYFNLDFCLFVCLSTLCPRSAIIVFTPGGHQQFADNPSYSLKDKKTQKKKKTVSQGTPPPPASCATSAKCQIETNVSETWKTSQTKRVLTRWKLCSDQLRGTAEYHWSIRWSSNHRQQYRRDISTPHHRLLSTWTLTWYLGQLFFYLKNWQFSTYSLNSDSFWH